MERLELRRHAPREPDADALSARGRALAESVGREHGPGYDALFVSPAGRAAETAAWILRGAGQQLPAHEVIPGLGGQDATGGSPEGMAAGVRALLDRIRARAPAGAYVNLLADGPGRGLYARHGFVETAPTSVGMARTI